MLDIVEVPTGYEVKFIYKPHLVTAIKQIPGVRFNGSQKHWYVPLQSKDILMKWAATLGGNKVSQVVVVPDELEPLPELTTEIKLKTNLFPYQSTGVAYGLQKKRLIIGDEPGLGKTGQAIAIVEAARIPLTLVICPASLKSNWQEEIQNKWTYRKALILTDRVKNTWQQYYRVGMINYVIVNYESLKKYFVKEINQPVDEATGQKKPLRLNHIVFNESIDLFGAVIIDEIHRCKEGKTQQTKFTMGICKGKEYILGLTGTPVVNKPMDLVPQLFIINRSEDFGGYKGFTGRYCQGYNQASNLKELNYMLNKHCFYRRLKKDVLKDLPDKMRSIIKIEITNRLEYQKAENNLIAYLRENLKKTDGEITTSLRGETMVLIGILKKIAARGKIEAVLEQIREVNEAGEKMITFAWHTEIVEALKKELPGSVTIVGSNSLEERDKAKRLFQQCKSCGVMLELHGPEQHEFIPSDTKNIICNIKSGGVGLTLTASSRVGFIELPWNPAGADQCEDRAHRIGQKDSVQVMYFLGQDTIDEHIYSIIQKKRGIVNQVTGTMDDTETVELSMVDEFINLFTKEKF